MRPDQSHALEPGITSARLFWVMSLDFLIAVIELVGGLASGSLSLLSDALHDASDGLAVAISRAALRSSLRPETERHIFGLRRAQILAARGS